MKNTRGATFRKVLSPVLLLTAFVLLAASVGRILEWGHLAGDAEAHLDVAIKQSELPATQIDELFNLRKERAEKLVKAHMFAPPPPEPQPPTQVQGIFGDAVLINGRWLKVGETIDGAKIIRIEATKVVIEWKGQEKTLMPIDSSSPGGPPGQSPPPPEVRSAKSQPDRKKPTPKASAAPPSVPAASAEEDPLAWLGVPLSEKARAALLKYWNQLNDEQKQKAREGWNKMPQEQKQMAVQQFENMPER